MPKALRIVGVAAAVVGSVLVIIGVVLGVRTLTFRSGAVHVTGTIVDVVDGRSCGGTRRGFNRCTDVHTPVIKFSTGSGDEMTITPDYRSSSVPPVGAKIEILYPPGDPGAARVDNFIDLWLAPTLLLGIGAPLGVAGGVITATMIRTSRRKAWLAQNGRRVAAQLQGVRRIDNVRINGRHPWRVVATWQDPGTGRQHTFTSELITDDPSAAIGGYDTIDVLVDPADPGRRHWMDLGSRAVDT